MAAPVRTARRIGRMLIRIAAAIALLCVVYLAAGLVGGAIPANSGRAPPKYGIPIYVADNGIHTDIVMPVSAAGVDWRGLVRPGDIADPRYAAHTHLAFGWGDRTFYVDTPTWADVDPRTVVSAAIGSSDTVLHVEHVPEPPVGPDIRRVLLTRAEYLRLAAYIRASFATGADGRAPSIHGYGPADAFYAARGHYDALHTCNDWTGAALRHAGIRMGQWTPFPVSVMAWL
ncbi:TIGR02117 family protein [Stakelama marina]|uniref:TIGR02117 family protein n=1 Tax=Stakelama marina TaxID=2826939 RepID=A0A8T4IHU1_9SPHN|nr:TIGR02117 family protein [Stakelama marina]MBR0552655.1 TIGR02117 family protein [Stakelama marina]